MYFPDFDECENSTVVCGNFTCRNTDQSYECICPSGYYHISADPFCLQPPGIVNFDVTTMFLVHVTGHFSNY